MFSNRRALLEVHDLLDRDLVAGGPDQLTEVADVLASARQVLDAFAVRVAGAARVFADRGDGTTPEAVLSGNGTTSSRREARKTAARAETAEAFPTVGDEVNRGTVPSENLDRLAAVRRGLTAEQAAELTSRDSELAHLASTLGPDAFTKAMRRLIDEITNDHGKSRAENQRANSKVKTWVGRDGMHHASVSLDPERGTEFFNDLESATNALANELGIPISDHLRAEAFFRLLRAGATNPNDGTSRPASIVAVTDTATLVNGPHEGTVRETWAGVPLAAETIKRLCCDATIAEVVLDEDGHPLHVGRNHRTATPAQRKALRALYDACPLSDTAFDRCEIHHVNVFWEDDGETNLDNLLPISRYWHHLVHEGGWTLTMHRDRSLELRRPNGELDRRIPPPTPITPRHRHDHDRAA